MYLVVFTYKYGCTVWPVSDDRHDAREGGWTWCPACARGPVMAHIGRNNSPLEKTVKTDKIYIYQKKYNELCKNNGDGSPLYGISRFLEEKFFLVVNNSRFLILPRVRLKLASHIIGQAFFVRVKGSRGALPLHALVPYVVKVLENGITHLINLFRAPDDAGRNHDDKFSLCSVFADRFEQVSEDGDGT